MDTELNINGSVLFYKKYEIQFFDKIQTLNRADDFMMAFICK
jgi:hypothetical protein